MTIEEAKANIYRPVTAAHDATRFNGKIQEVNEPDNLVLVNFGDGNLEPSFWYAPADLSFGWTGDWYKPPIVSKLIEENFIIETSESDNAIIHYHYENGWLKGSVYPISAYNPEELKQGKGFYYCSATSSDMIESREKARILFDFSFCWRGVWEGRIYFRDDEYWSEELKDIADMWAIIEQQLKQILRNKNPDNEFMHKDE